MTQPRTLFFLPGATGRADFWRPLAGTIDLPAQQRLLAWPGFGDAPARGDVNGFDDLVDMVLAEMERADSSPCALIAQSMGGAIALRAALARPQAVSHLVLTATSGGIDLGGTGAVDWRPAFFAANPQLPRWFGSYREDLSQQLPTLHIPTLLIWGDSDPISPVAVGVRLRGLLRNARLHVVPGGDHDVAQTHAQQLAPIVAGHLRQT
jgi:pimeloyl-ACP methyl ester carboxylesterase